ncbi:hypothetical protein VTO42DRAFT_3019 [Malbranchea cinnamomea]
MKRPLRIAVLECDVPLTQTRAKYGGYGGLFETLLRSAAETLNQPDIVHPQDGLEVTKWNIVDDDKYPSLDDVDGILLTGSKHTAFHNDLWILRLVEFTKKVLAQDRVRMVGICFGHQIIARALGAKLGSNEKGWEVAVRDVDLTEEGKKLFGLEKLRIQQMHRDIVYSLPPSTIPLGSSPLCEVQGMYSPRRFITVQGHPEFNEEIVREIIQVRRETGVFSQEVYEAGMETVANEHDGLALARTFIKFLAED